MSQEPQTVSEPQNAVPLTVTERIALRLFAIKADIDPGHVKARRWWMSVIDEEDRESWRREARALLADLATGDQDEMRAAPEYEVRRSENCVHGPLDDIGDAVDFADNVWPGSKVFERSRVSVRSEWTEVTA